MPPQSAEASKTPKSDNALLPPEPIADFSVISQSLRKGTWIVMQTIVLLRRVFGLVKNLWEQYKQLIVLVVLLFLAVTVLQVILAFALAVIGALNDIPLLAPTFQLIGIGYSIWFGWRYLLKPSTRSELWQQTEQFFSQPAADEIDSGEIKQLYEPGIVATSSQYESATKDQDDQEQGIPSTDNQEQLLPIAEINVVSTNETEQLYKPGEIVPTSGQYQLINSDGSNQGREVTSTKGEHFPPTPESGMHYQLVDATLHKSNQESSNQPDENNTVNIGSEQLYKPGEIVPTSGQYQLINPVGASEGREVTSTKGEHFPPTPESGMHYQLVDPTQHKHN